MRIHPQPAGVTALDWSANSGAAPNVRPTTTQPAAGAALRNVCTSITVIASADGNTPSAGQVTVALIDGPSGGTNIKWGPHPISIPAVAGSMNGIAKQPLWIPGSINTPMTLETSGALGAHVTLSVSMEGTICEAGVGAGS